jgi:polyisoprenoid-binding protein YceI
MEACRLRRIVHGQPTTSKAVKMVLNTEIMREVGRTRLPIPGTWFIDPVHSRVEFIARHMMVSKVRGRFRDMSGVIYIDQVPERSAVEATLDAASIDTGDEQRDNHLRSADFLDVERYPVLRFVSVSLSRIPLTEDGDSDKWQLDGELTVKDMTRPVSLEVELGGVVVDPWGNVRAGFQAWTEINREDFGITWNQALEAGGFLVGKWLKVEIEVEAVRQSDSDE